MADTETLIEMGFKENSPGILTIGNGTWRLEIATVLSEAIPLSTIIQMAIDGYGRHAYGLGYDAGERYAKKMMEEYIAKGT